MRELFLVFHLAFPGAQGGDSWLGPDKVQHYFSAAFVQSASYGTLRRAGAGHAAALAGASTATAAVSLGKEWRDRNVKGDFSARDLVWDAAGAGSATLLLLKAR